MAPPGKARCVTKASGRKSASRWAAATPMSAFRVIPTLLGDPLSAFHQWNLGAAFTWQQLGLGVAYTDDNGGIDANGKNRTWVAGVDWTTGPFKLGASYLNNHEGLGQNGALVRPGHPGHDALGGWCGLHLRPRHDLPRFGRLGPHGSSRASSVDAGDTSTSTPRTFCSARKSTSNPPGLDKRIRGAVFRTPFSFENKLTSYFPLSYKNLDEHRRRQHRRRP